MQQQLLSVIHKWTHNRHKFIDGNWLLITKLDGKGIKMSPVLLPSEKKTCCQSEKWHNQVH